ncbi:hypothetical protein [Polyangium aurulentum]|uniref:hypothetical protein n=1 Tax=Polyangium aurulentum TaxID=2567896 RepID=UPI0010AE669D|nr:hypothetical protein [Polyangium aurulentum]UQA55751.1 hypothetical protein E8A73_031010 [Polyangium aurulentum]
MAYPAAHRAFFGLFAFTLAASCTFPDVEYDMPCTVPTLCQKNAEGCLKDAEVARNACLAKCKMTPNGNCGSCTADFETDLDQCLDTCDGCGAQSGCMNATQSCKTHLGIQ